METDWPLIESVFVLCFSSSNRHVLLCDISWSGAFGGFWSATKVGVRI